MDTLNLKNKILKIQLQNTIYGISIVILHRDMGRIKKRVIAIPKDQMEGVKKALLDNKWLDHDNIKIDRKRIGFAGLVIWIAFITLFFSNSLFENIGLNGMWHLGFTFVILNTFILFSVVKGLIESYLWKKAQKE